MAGLTTKEALLRLSSALRALSTNFVDFPSHLSSLSAISTPTVVLICLSATTCLAISASLSMNFINFSDLWMTIVMIVVLVINFVVIWRRQRLAASHFCKVIVAVSTQLECLSSCKDTDSRLFYPSTKMPPSELDANLQWTIRDGMLVTVPHLLLVDGDLILLRPGQVVHVNCQLLPDRKVSLHANNPSLSSTLLKPGSIYIPPCDDVYKQAPHICPGYTPMKALVLDAAVTYLLNKFIVEKRDQSKKQLQTFRLQFRTGLRLICCAQFVLCILFPTLAICVVLLTNRYSATKSNILDLIAWILSSSGKFLLCLTCLGSTPLVKMVILSLASARFHQHIIFPSLLSLRTTKLGSKKISMDCFQKYPKNSNCCRETSNLLQSVMKNICLEGLILNFHSLWRHLVLDPRADVERLMLALGTVSSVCCVDRAGVLARPTVSAEKVFFFSSVCQKSHHHRHHGQTENSDVDRDMSPRSRHSQRTPSTQVNVGLPVAAYAASGVSRSSSYSCRAPSLFSTSDHDVHSELSNSPAEVNDHHGVGVVNMGDVNWVGIRTEDNRDHCDGSLNESHCKHVHHPSRLKKHRYPCYQVTIPTVLDLRSDSHWPYLCRFENPNWNRYLPCLKPIGLSVLLNSACQCHYSPVASTHRAFEDYLSVLVQRTSPSNHAGAQPYSRNPSTCLCSLASHIGFRQTAVNNFEIVGALSACCWQQPVGEVPTKFVDSSKACEDSSEERVTNQNDPISGYGNYAVSTGYPANCFAILMKERMPSHVGDTKNAEEQACEDDCSHNHVYQLMCQSTGDMSVRLCSDLWNGRDVVPLSNVNRDLILDFYHRHASAAYCISISYSPVLERPLPISTICGDPVTSTPLIVNLSQNKHRQSYNNTEEGTSLFDAATMSSTYEQFLRGRTGKAFQSVSASNQCSTTRDPQHSIRRVRSTSELGHYVLGPTPLTDVSSRPPARRSTQHPPFSLLDQTGASVSSVDGCNVNISHTDNGWKCENPDAGDLQSLLEGQVFLGLVSLQYQTNSRVVEAVKHFEQACIRFVYFSSENELRSRVFAERLGLEAGWNCHISLAEQQRDPTDPTATTNPSTYSHKIEPLLSKAGKFTQSDDDSVQVEEQLRKVQSSPLLQFKPTLSDKQPTFSSDITDVDHHNLSCEPDRGAIDSPFRSAPPTVTDVRNRRYSSSSVSSTSTSGQVNARIEGDVHSHRSDMRLSDYLTKNKSRLPCGIESIRPHLEHVDNVPLQVSLFTDCQPEAIRHMVDIMQEYGETVCTVVSCFSYHHLLLLAHGDAAILVRPILPRPCYEVNTAATTDVDGSTQLHADPQPSNDGDLNSPLLLEEKILQSPSPSTATVSALDLAIQLTNVLTPCIFDLQRHGFLIYELINEAHSIVNNVYHAFTFLLVAPLANCVISVFLMLLGFPNLPVYFWNVIGAQETNVTSPLYFLPGTGMFLASHLLGSPYSMFSYVNPEKISSAALFSYGHMMWLLVIVIPALSLSLMDRRIERGRLLREPPWKRGKPPLSRKKHLRICLITTLRFMPSALVCVVSAVGFIVAAPGFHACQLSGLSANTSLFTVAPLPDLQPYSVTLNDSDVPANASHRALLCFRRLNILTEVTNEIIFSQLVVYLVLTSFTYANFGQPIWRFTCWSNPSWCSCAFVIILVQLIHLTVTCFRQHDVLGVRQLAWEFVAPVPLGLSVLWCPILLILNELITLKESRLLLAEHRLARLYFGTKLGMYSPV